MNCLVESQVQTFECRSLMKVHHKPVCVQEAAFPTAANGRHTVTAVRDRVRREEAGLLFVVVGLHEVSLWDPG